jgi:hypothetical protein
MFSYRSPDFWLGSEYCIVDFMDKNNTDTSKLVSVKCVGAAVNSDTRGGVIRFLEE